MHGTVILVTQTFLILKMHCTDIKESKNYNFCKGHETNWDERAINMPQSTWSIVNLSPIRAVKQDNVMK